MNILFCLFRIYANYILILFLLFTYAVALTQETCNNGLDDDFDGYVDCYDSDCYGSPSCNSFFYGQSASCTHIPSATAFDMKEKWRTSITKHDVFSTLSPVAADIDNDGVVEVLAYNHNGLIGGAAGPGNKIYIINGNSGIIKDSIIMPVNAALLQQSGMAIGDLDNDGFGEIVVIGTDASIRCYEHTTTLKWTSPALSNGHTPVLGIADFNGDGSPEIYASTYIFNGQTGAQIAVGSFPPSGSYGAPSGILVSLGMTIAADVLPSGFCADCSGMELVAGNNVYSVNIGTGSLVIQNTASAPGADGFTALADYDMDGDLDAIISTNSLTGISGQVNVYVWDIQTPSIMATSSTFVSPTFWTIGQTTVGDFDGDGLIEIGVVTENAYKVLDDHLTGLALKWSKAVSDISGYTSSILFDFQGDGTHEIIYQSEDSLYIFKGTDGATIGVNICRSGTSTNHPIIVDVDSDDIAEIICGCSEGIGTDPRLHGFIRAYEPDSTIWLNARKVWNQHSYFVTNVNDDLNIPIQQQQNSLLGNGTILNGFNFQSTTLNTNGMPLFAAPDAFVSSLNINLDNCGSGSNVLTITIEIANLSSDALIPVKTPIALYNGDPQMPGATLIDTVQTTKNLDNTLTDILIKSIPDQGGTLNLYVVVNDRGQDNLPIVFPSTGVPECNYSNNIVACPIISCALIHTPLPVSLISFNAMIEKNLVSLVWATETEINNDYFTIERSLDANRWIYLKNIQAKGNSFQTTHYNTHDEKPHGKTVYYRLSQTDFDGKKTNLAIKSVTSLSEVSLKIFPNPAKDEVNILIEQEENVRISIDLFNPSGQLVLSKLLNNLPNILDVSGLEAGVYFIRIISDNYHFIEKLVIE